MGFGLLGVGDWASMLLSPTSVVAAERYAVVISGVSGGEKYAAQQKKWREEIETFLTAGLAFPDANIVILDEEGGGSSLSTAENIRQRLRGSPPSDCRMATRCC